MTFISRAAARTSRRAVVRRADVLLDGNRVEEATTLLAGTLRHLDPATAAPNRHTFDAATRYVRIVDGDPQAIPPPLGWARYAHRTARTLHPGDPGVLEESAVVLAVALGKHGPPDEAITACREVIHLAGERGDDITTAHWRLNLAAYLHENGRCVEAADEAIAALHGYDPGNALDTYQAVMETFALLDTCHRHDDATRIATRIRVTDLPDEPLVGALLTAVEEHSPSLRTHTERYHRGERCSLTGCAVRDGTDMPDATLTDPRTTPTAGYPTVASRLFAALLSGLDPADAPPHGPLIDIAERHAALAPFDPDDAAVLGWAWYAHRGRLSVAGLDLDAVSAATGIYIRTLQRHGQLGADGAGWYDAVMFAEDRDDLDAVDVYRMELADVLYRDGQCREALGEAVTATTSWQQRHPETSITTFSLLMRTALMHTGCHLHHETQLYGHQVRLEDLPDDIHTNRTATSLLGQLGDMARTHALTHHPREVCQAEHCPAYLTAADTDDTDRSTGPGPSHSPLSPAPSDGPAPTAEADA